MSAALKLVRDTERCPPPELTKYDIIEDARALARKSNITDLGALNILVERGDLPTGAVYGALEYLERVARMGWMVELLRGEDDDELAFIAGGVCCCHRCARSYLMNDVTAEIDYDMLLETKRVGYHEAWECDRCGRSFALPSERERAWR